MQQSYQSTLVSLLVCSRQHETLQRIDPYQSSTVIDTSRPKAAVLAMKLNGQTTGAMLHTNHFP
uniref:Uncharacterized protein n=1 Tax=Arundo donax TaxID=35708 RepID=A0A0A9H1S7_ARUDO